MTTENSSESIAPETDFYTTYKDLTEAEKQADDLERKLKELDAKMDAILESQDLKDLQTFIDENKSTLDSIQKDVDEVAQRVEDTGLAGGEDGGEAEQEDTKEDTEKDTEKDTIESDKSEEPAHDSEDKS